MSGRVPPNDLAAERAVLGGLLLENEALDIVAEASLSVADFYSDANGKIYAAIQELHANGQPVDGVTLRAKLETKGHLVAVGGDEYLLGLTDTIPTVANIQAHAKIVHDKALVRTMIAACHAVSALGYGDYGTVEEFLDSAESAIAKAGDARAIGGDLHHIRGIVEEVFVDLTDRAEGKPGSAGVPTGFDDLDRYLSGMEEGLLYLIAGRPGSGKTAASLNIIRNIAETKGTPALFFSLEMPKKQLAQRLLASEALVDGGKMREAALSRDDWPKLAAAADTLQELPIYVDDTPNHDIDDICRVARKKHREEGLSVVCIDYIQLVCSTQRKHGNREQEIGYISRSLKGLAKELSIPVIGLSQLNRGLESRTEKRPLVSDLRESGNLEQDADTIIFIYRDEVYNPDTKDRGLAEFIIGKQRQGPTGTVKLVFRKEFVRFETWNGGHDDPQQTFVDPTQERY